MKILLALCLVLPLVLNGCSSSKAHTYKKMDAKAKYHDKDKMGAKKEAEDALYAIKALCEGGKPELPPNIQLPCEGKDCPPDGGIGDGKFGVLCNGRLIAYEPVGEVEMVSLPRAAEVNVLVSVNGETVLEAQKQGADMKDAAMVCQTVEKFEEEASKIFMATCEDFEHVDSVEELAVWCVAQLIGPIGPTPKSKKSMGVMSTCDVDPVDPTDPPDVCNTMECEPVPPIELPPVDPMACDWDDIDVVACTSECNNVSDIADVAPQCCDGTLVPEADVCKKLEPAEPSKPGPTPKN